MSGLSALSPHLETLIEQAPQGERIYLVGGAVRDFLMQRPIHDLDLVVEGDARPLARRVANRLKGDFYMLDPVRQTARVLIREENGSLTCFDFASLRHPDIESDLRDRDFSINALAVELRQLNQLIDPTGGLADLRGKRLKACSPTAFLNDPIRVIRGARMSLELGFRIDDHTVTLMREAVAGLKKVSQERIRDEVFRILEGEKPAVALRLLDHLGAVAIIFPELPALKTIEQSLPHHQNAWEHTLATVSELSRIFSLLCSPFSEEKTQNLLDGLTVLRLGRFRQHFIEHFTRQLNPNRNRRGLLFFAALYHDCAKPQAFSKGEDGVIHFINHENLGAELTRMRASTLALSQAEVDHLAILVRHHLRIHQLAQEGKAPSSRAVYRYFRNTGEVGVELVLLALADRLAMEGVNLSPENWQHELDVCRLLLEAWWEKREQVLQPVRWVNGSDLMKEFNLAPGKQIGALLEAISEAQALGEVTTREEALRYAKEWLSQMDVNL